MTNREEVAERLRVYATDFDFGDSNPIWYVEKAVFNDIRIREQGRVFSSLADLIDPTCKLHITSEILTESITKYTAECSNCGAIFGDFPTMEQAKTTHPVYCPSCGARVVRDDDMKEPKTVEEQTVLPSSDYVDNQTLALAT